jgi:hypothetical protein
MFNKKKVAFLFNSRNNYHLFEQMFFRMSNCDFSDVIFFNVDIDSTQEQKEYGRALCKECGIIDINMDDDPLRVAVPRTLERVFDYIEQNGLDIDWVMWASHDNIIKDRDFILKFQQFVESKKEINEKVGVIGFAVNDHETDGDTVYGRATLIKDAITKYRGSYKNLPESFLNTDYFIVESVCFTNVFYNRELYRKYIKPDYNFKLYVFGDDISFQFMMNNVVSITVPSLEIIDGSRKKAAFGVNRAYDSFLNKSDYYHLDNTMDHQQLWKEKWGFDLFREQAREQIKNNIERFRGTLIEKMLKWDIDDGPKKLEDI